jgi:hypothetical protein
VGLLILHKRRIYYNNQTGECACFQKPKPVVTMALYCWHQKSPRLQKRGNAYRILCVKTSLIFHKNLGKHQRGSKENRCDARRWIKLDQDHVQWYFWYWQWSAFWFCLVRPWIFTVVELLDRAVYHKRIGCCETSLIINKHQTNTKPV